MWFVPLLFAASTLSACLAQAVEQDRFGGTLELPDSTSASMESAEDLMEQHCGFDNWRVHGWEKLVVDELTDPPTTSVYLYYSCLRPTSPTLPR